MRKLILIIKILLITQLTNAQAVQLDTITYFNKTYYSDTMSFISTAIEPIEDGYLVFGGYNIASPISRNSVHKIGKEGNFLHLINFDYGTESAMGVIGTGEQVIQNTVGNLILAYSYDTTYLATGARRLFKLVEMDLEGNVLQSALIGEDTTKRHIARAIVEVEDGYVFTGYQGSVEENTSRIAVVKVDFDFNEIWTKYYVESFGDGFIIRKTNWDNGFIIGAWSFTSEDLRYDNHTLKLDSNGDLEWEYIDNVIGETCVALPIIPNNSINYTEDADIEYIILSCQEPPSDSFGASMDLTFSKLDKDGNLISKKIYDDASFDRAINFQSSILLNDSTIIADINNNFSIGDTNVLLTNISTKDGEVRWVQTLQANEVNDREDYARDLQATEDGGFILAGFRRYPGVQRSWVVKTDSLGNTCGFANCDSLVVIETIIEEPEDSTGVFIQDLENADFTVYPNPARGGFITVGFNPSFKKGKYRIVNALGQQVLSGQLNENGTINIQDLNMGMYYLELSNGQYSRFVVMK